MADPVSAAVAIGWGLKAAGWVAKPAISELYKKGSSFLGFDAAEKLKELERKVLLLERVMGAVEESPDRPYLEQLFLDLKSNFYVAEGILDDVEYQRLERQIRDDKLKSDGSIPQNKKDWLMEKFKSALPSSPLKNKDTGMSKMKLQKALEKIEHVINEACQTLERLNLSNISNSNGGQTTATKSCTTSTSPVEVIGRDKDREKITSMLHHKERDGLCYSVVGIHGISGSGKTTLAQLVCAHEKTNDYFDLIMWVQVSQSFCVASIYREMVDVASDYSGSDVIHYSDSDAIHTNLDSLQDFFSSKLCDKRFLLVLDDVWCNKDPSNQNLPQLLSPLKSGKRGSKILVTSRNADALSDLGPDVQSTPFPIHDLNDSDFLKLFMYHALGDRTADDQDGSTFRDIGAQIAEKLKRSPLAARIVGGQLRKRQNVDYWRKSRDQDLLSGTMGALSWSYQHLDVEVRRCFAYCSVFPGRRPLRRDELVRMWVAEGLIRNNNGGKELEDVGEEYFDELVSSSFLQLGVKGFHYQNYYVMHDLLHHLAERVTENDCFRIESGLSGEVPRGVRHLFVENLSEEMIMKGGIELENLRTLIINSIGVDTPPLEDKVLKSMFRRLRKLRVLSIGFVRQPTTNFSLPTTIGLLKHLRLLSFRIGPSCQIILPSTFTKLYQIQTLDFGDCTHLSFPSGEEIVNLVSLRYATRNVLRRLHISRSTSLRTVLPFSVDQKHKLKRLRDLNKIRGSLFIDRLNRVESMEEALEAKLADKEGLTELTLSFYSDLGSINEEVEAEVLEGLCPPMFLESLRIYNYDGARYPNWMVNKQSSGPKYLRELILYKCSRLGPAPELFEVFYNLRSFSLSGSSWDALPSSIEHLRFLKKLKIYKCLNIRSLPALPQSLETFELYHCDEVFMRSCQTIGDANWQKIQHIDNREFSPSVSSSRSKGVSFDDNVSIIGGVWKTCKSFFSPCGL